MAKKYVGGGDIITAKKVDDIVKARKQPMGTAPKGGMPEEDDMGPLPKYKPKSVSSKIPEPTFKSDVDNIVSGVKKVDKKINDTLDPSRKVMVKAAGKEEPGVLSKYSGLTKFVPEAKKKGGAVKTKCMVRGGGIEVRGKTKGRFV